MNESAIFVTCMVLAYAGLAWIDHRSARPMSREKWASVVRRTLKACVVESEARSLRARMLYAQMIGRATRPSYPAADRLVGVPEVKPPEGSAMAKILRDRVLTAKAWGEGRFKGSPVHVYRDIPRRMVQVWHMGDDDHEGRWMSEIDFRMNHGVFPRDRLVTCSGDGEGYEATCIDEHGNEIWHYEHPGPIVIRPEPYPKRGRRT